MSFLPLALRLPGILTSGRRRTRSGLDDWPTPVVAFLDVLGDLV
jgi:hypothetical protein